MSFQRPLTGESSLIATVVLNTNICSNSVSTVNLSATNACFVNITTNTWQSGNVSTPNVIATNGYFSNLYITNLNTSSGNFSNIYSSNSSITNLSTSLISVSNISAFMINSSTVSVSNLYVKNGYASNISIGNTSVDKLTANNLSSTQINTCLLYVSTMYSSNILNRGIYYNTSGSGAGEYPILSIQNYNVSYGGVTRPATRFDGENASRMLFTFSDSTYNPMTLTYGGVSVTNLSVNASLSVSVVAASLMDIDGTITGNIGRFQFYELKNSAANTIMTLEQPTVNSSRIQLQIENSGITGYDITRLGVSILTLNTSESTFYSPLTVSSFTASSITTSTITTSTFAVSNLSVSNISATRITTTGVSSTNASITSLDVAYELNYRTSGNGLLYNFNATAGSQGSVYYNALNSQTARHRFQYLDQDLMSINSSQILVYNPLNSSYRFSVSYMSVSSLNVCGSDSATIYTSGLTLRNFSINPSTLHMAYPTQLQLNYVANQGGVPTESYGMRLTTDINDAVIDASNYLNFAITHIGVSAVEHIRTTATSRRWNFYSPIYNVCNTCLTNVSANNASLTNVSITNLSADNFNVSTLASENVSITNLSVTTALTAVSGTVTTLNSTSAFISNLSASNISVPGRISVSNISAIAVSATGRITADTFRGTTWIISNGNLSGADVFGVTLNTCNIFCSQQINSSMVSCREVSTSMIYTSNTSFRNASAGNASITTLTGTTVGYSTGNFSTIAVSNPVVNMSVSNMYCSGLNLITNGTVSTYGQISLTSGKMLINSVGNAATALTFANTGNVRFEISSAGVSSYATFYASTANFSNLNVSNFTLPSTINTNTINASNGNFSSFNVSSFNPGAVNTTLVNASNGYFSALYASTWVLPTTLDVSQVNASNICAPNATIDNISNVGSIFTLGSTILTTETLNIRSYYASVGGIPYMQMDYWKSSSSALDRGITMYSDQTRASVIDGGTLPLELRQNDIAQASVSSVSGWLFKNIINTSYQTNISKLAVSNMSMSGTANISTVNASTFNASSTNIATIGSDTGNIITVNSTTVNASTVNSSIANNTSGTFTTMSNFTLYSSNINVSRINNVSAYVSNISINYASIDNITAVTASATSLYTSNISTSNMSITTALTIPNTVTCNASNAVLTLHSATTNTQTTGIKVPNYIDGVDLNSGLFVGYNHTAGFINFNRTIRSYSNITLDGNLNQITTTNNLGIGRNLTTGHLWLGDSAMTGNVCINTSGTIQIGNTAMTGNISIDTAGDVVFGCDRRSTWNTSGIIASSTQLGSFYRQVASVVSTTKTTTGQTFLFSPVGGNTSLTVVPVGLYLVTASGFIRTQSAYNASVTAANIGTCYGATYPDFTNGNTTRQYHQTLGNLNTSGTTNNYWHLAFTGVVNMSVTNQYIGAFMSVTAAQAATVGNIYFELSNVTVIKIA